jgi:hypothetical protein
VGAVNIDVDVDVDVDAYRVGGTPTTRANATLNALAEL